MIIFLFLYFLTQLLIYGTHGPDPTTHTLLPYTFSEKFPHFPNPLTQHPTNPHPNLTQPRAPAPYTLKRIHINIYVHVCNFIRGNGGTRPHGFWWPFMHRKWRKGVKSAWPQTSTFVKFFEKNVCVASDFVNFFQIFPAFLWIFAAFPVKFLSNLQLFMRFSKNFAAAAPDFSKNRRICTKIWEFSKIFQRKFEKKEAADFSAVSTSSFFDPVFRRGRRIITA